MLLSSNILQNLVISISPNSRSSTSSADSPAPRRDAAPFAAPARARRARVAAPRGARVPGAGRGRRVPSLARTRRGATNAARTTTRDAAATALERLPLVRDAPLSMARARLLAMVHASWRALHYATTKVISETKTKTKTPPQPQPQLSRYTVGHILHELARLQHPTALRRHPDRERAMRWVAAPGSVPAFVMYVVAQRGSLESVVYLHQVARYDPSEALDAAAKAGHSDVVSWLLDNAHTAKWATSGASVVPTYQYRHDPDLGIMAWRVQGHSFDGVYAMTKKWGYDWRSSDERHVYPVIDLAAKHGDIGALYRLDKHSIFRGAYSVKASENAAAAGVMLSLYWLNAMHPETFVDSKALIRAMVEGHLEVAKWLVAYDVGVRVKVSTFAKVTKRGHLDVLQWMMETFPELVPPHDPRQGLACVAAENGHARTVEWLAQEKGYTIGYDVLHYAVKSGDLAFAQWAQARCFEPVHAAVLNAGAVSGNVAVARWVVEDLKQWCTRALRFATHCVTTTMVEYTHGVAVKRVSELGSPHLQEEPFKWAEWIMKGYFDTFEWLLQHGYTRGLFRNETHFKMVDYVDHQYATKYASLGWENEDIRDSEWPKTPAAIRRLHEVMDIFIDLYDPDFVRGIPWFPAWTVRNRRFKALIRLANINHPRLGTWQFARLLLRETRDPAVVRWFVERFPSLFTTHVVRWAVEHDKRELLAWIFDRFLPGQGDEVSTHKP